MGEEQIISMIGQLGFPIFVAVWMLFKESKNSENMIIALNELKTAINLLNEKVGNQ